MRALITAERPETLGALQRDAAALQRSLNEAGLRLDGGGLSFSLKHDGGREHSTPGGAHGLPWRSDRAAGDEAATAPLRPGPPARSLRLLDIHA